MKIGLDFGTANTVLCIKDEGIVIHEPTVAAITPIGEVAAVGREALLLYGRTPTAVTLRYPLKSGCISDYNLAAEYLTKILSYSGHGRKEVLAAVHTTDNAATRDLLYRAIADCGVSGVGLIEAPIATVRGMNESADNPDRGVVGSDEPTANTGILLCDIGAGHIETVYYRDGDILRSETANGSGNDANMKIRYSMRRYHGLAISEDTAENIKYRLDLTAENPDMISVSGLDTSTGMPRKIKIPATELMHAMSPQITAVADNIRAVLTNLPRQNGIADTVDRIILYGGGASLGGIGDYISALTELPVIIAPDNIVAIGLEMML